MWGSLSFSARKPIRLLAGAMSARGVRGSHLAVVSVFFSAVAVGLLLASAHGQRVVCFVGAACCIQLRWVCLMLQDVMVGQGKKRSEHLGLVVGSGRVADFLIILGVGHSMVDVRYALEVSYFAVVATMVLACLRNLRTSSGPRHWLGGTMYSWLWSLLTISLLVDAYGFERNLIFTTFYTLIVVSLFGLFNEFRRPVLGASA